MRVIATPRVYSLLTSEKREGGDVEKDWKRKGDEFWAWFTKTYQIPQGGNSRQYPEWPSIPTMSINHRRWRTED